MDIDGLLPAVKQAKQILGPAVDRISIEFEFIGQHEGRQRMDATVFAHFFGTAVMVQTANVTEPDDLYTLVFTAAQAINKRIGEMNAKTAAEVAAIGAKVNALYGVRK